MPSDYMAFSLKQTVAAKNAGDANVLGAALRKCATNDPAFNVATSSIRAGTPKELARRLAVLQVAAAVPIEAGAIEVLPCWTPGRVAEAEHRLGSADGGTGPFAVVRLRIVPRRSGEGNQFESEFAGPPEIDAFNAAVERGVASVWAEGINGEGTIVDTRVVFIDGAFHSTRSNPAGFERAAAAAMRTACASAAIRRLEPFVHVEIEVGRDHVRPVVNDLAACGGSEIRRRLAPSGVIIVAELPMRAFLAYEARLAALSDGRGKVLGEPQLARFAEVRRS
jgi:elongation factor G